MKISTATLHQAVTIPGYGVTERTLNRTKLPGIEMEYGPQGLILSGRSVKSVIPHANVAVATIDESEAAPKKGK